MPRRTIIAITAGSVVALIAIGVAVFVFASDDALPTEGDQIAYSCKEPGNVWYAICVIHKDGTESRRLTSGIPATDPAWSPNGSTIAFTQREDVGDYPSFSEDDVFVMDSDGGGQQQLTAEVEGRHAGQPEWSPDGRRSSSCAAKRSPRPFPHDQASSS